MSDRSNIEWTDATWNPVTGCTKVSPGCDHCYAETLAERFRGTPGHYYERGFDLQLRPEKLDQPLRWRRPRRVLVNSMSDLFHDQVPDEYIARVWAVMALAPQHTFQVLTKRHGRMRSLLSSDRFDELFAEALYSVEHPRGEELAEPNGSTPGPLPNVWLGASLENQQWADIRIPPLLTTPAAVRFLSCEPLLGPVSLFANTKIDTDTLVDWVIVGGESGRGARPMHPSWVRQLRSECTTYGIPFHFKQWGEWVTEAQSPEDIVLPATGWSYLGDEQPTVYKVGKKAAGRDLDGRTWDEYPATVPA